MATVRDDEVLPRTRRQPGVYVGQEVTLPVAATYVTALADSRGLWTPRAAQEIVLTLTIEAFLDEAWVVLGGFTTDASEKLGKDGTPLDASSVRVRLPRTRQGIPPVRTTLQCASACTAAVRLIFDDVPIPVRAAHEHQSVTYDNDNEAVGTAVNSITIGSFPVANNANRCMLVGSAGYDATLGNTIVSSISHDGSTAGWASVVTNPGPGGVTDRASIWRKVAPSAVSAPVVVTFAGTCDHIGANALSLYDVDQTTPIGTAASAEGTSGAATVNVSSATGGMVYDVVYNYGNSLTNTGTVGASQTQRANTVLKTYAGARALMLASTEPGAATVTMSWTLSHPDEWVQAACPIQAAPAGGKATKNTRASPLGMQAGYPRRQGLVR